MRKLNALTTSLLFVASAANADGGSLAVPVAIKYTGADKCVPGTVTKISLAISSPDVQSLQVTTTNPAPAIKSGLINVPLTNCAVGTKLTIKPNSGQIFNSGMGVQLLAAATGSVVGGNASGAAMWKFNNAKDAFGLLLHVRSDADNQTTLVPLTTQALVATKVYTKDILSAGYSVIVKSKTDAYELDSGDYEATGGLTISIL